MDPLVWLNLTPIGRNSMTFDHRDIQGGHWNIPISSIVFCVRLRLDTSHECGLEMHGEFLAVL